MSNICDKSTLFFRLLLGVFSIHLNINASIPTQQLEKNTEGKFTKNPIPIEHHISPWVIPPGSRLNKFNLLLVIGQDEELAESPIQLFTTSGFKNMLKWDNEKTLRFREAAISWFKERFGIDFSSGVYDPTTESIITDFGMLIPYYYQGYLRVLLSNNLKIPPYTPITPSSVGQAEYVVIFFGTPTYSGTYANGGSPIIGKASDNLAFGCSRIFLDYSGNSTYTIFDRSYYPIETVTHFDSPNRLIDRYQLYSPEFGPGFSLVSSSMDTAPNQNGTFSTNAIATWCFPGSHLKELSDYNGFTQSPVEP